MRYPIAGIALAVAVMFASNGWTQDLIRNGGFNDPPPATIGALPEPWTGSAQTTNAADPRFPTIPLDDAVALFEGPQTLGQPVAFDLAGVDIHMVVTKATLSMEVYNPDSEITISIAGKDVATVARSLGTALLPVSFELWDIDLNHYESIDFRTTSGGAGSYALVDNIRLYVVEKATPTPPHDEPTPLPTEEGTPTATFTPTPTVTMSPTPTPTATETDEEKGTFTPTPTATPFRQEPAGIIVTAHPSLLLLAVGTKDPEDITEMKGSGISSYLRIELVAEDGSRINIEQADREHTTIDLLDASIGEIDQPQLVDGVLEAKFYPWKTGMAVIRVTFVRTKESGEPSYVFTEMVNIQIRRDRTGSILGEDGIRRPRLNPPKRPMLYFDIRR